MNALNTLILYPLLYDQCHINISHIVTVALDLFALTYSSFQMSSSMPSVIFQMCSQEAIIKIKLTLFHIIKEEIRIE